MAKGVLGRVLCCLGAALWSENAKNFQKPYISRGASPREGTGNGCGNVGGSGSSLQLFKYSLEYKTRDNGNGKN